MSVLASHIDGSVEYNTHQLYGLSECLATAAAVREVVGKRPFVLSRASYLGLGAYAAHWTGDNAGSAGCGALALSDAGCPGGRSSRCSGAWVCVAHCFLRDAAPSLPSLSQPPGRSWRPPSLECWRLACGASRWQVPTSAAFRATPLQSSVHAGSASVRSTPSAATTARTTRPIRSCTVGECAACLRCCEVLERAPPGAVCLFWVPTWL